MDSNYCPTSERTMATLTVVTAYTHDMVLYSLKNKMIGNFIIVDKTSQETSKAKEIMDSFPISQRNRLRKFFTQHSKLRDYPGIFYRMSVDSFDFQLSEFFFFFLRRTLNCAKV